MNNQNQEKRINTKQLFGFLGIAGVITVITVGALFFFSSTPKAEDNQAAIIKPGKPTVDDKNNDGFLGEKGIAVKNVEGDVYIEESQVSDGNMHAFNFYSEAKGKTIYFFVVKAEDGTYRVAANACEVCFEAKKGFAQVDDLIRCENCRVSYSKDKIALEKGGCNPAPINRDAIVKDGKLIIKVSEIEDTAYLF